MAQALDNEIQSYLPLLRNSEKMSLLSVIKSFLSLREIDESVNMVEYNRELDEAEAEFDKGDFISNEQMMKQVKQW